jgi:hypothetical protein
LTIAITIEANRQMTRMIRLAAQRRGTGRS